MLSTICYGLLIVWAFSTVAVLMCAIWHHFFDTADVDPPEVPPEYQRPVTTLTVGSADARAVCLKAARANLLGNERMLCAANGVPCVPTESGGCAACNDGFGGMRNVV